MSALTLRIIAVVCMLIDHIGYYNDSLHFLRYPGRLAFPIFVFLMVNGYRHTKDKILYGSRLLMFAIISQIPYALFFFKNPLEKNGNVLIDLLLGLICISLSDALRKRAQNKRVGALLSVIPFVAVIVFLQFTQIKIDYGIKGIALAAVFWYFDGKKIPTVIGSAIAVFLPTIIDFVYQALLIATGRTHVFTLPDNWTCVQAVSLLALIPIFLYNGKKGITVKNKIGAKLFQLSFYIFYPAHLLILYFINK